MKVFERLGLLIRADAHGVMDQLEERSLLLRQHLRDAELALGELRARAAAIDEELVRLGEAAGRAEARLAELDGDVELALSRGEPELARYAVRRLLPARAAHGELRERTRELEAARERLAPRLREREAAFESLRARVAAELDALAREEQALGAQRPLVTDEDVELELLRRRPASASRAGAAAEVSS